MKKPYKFLHMKPSEYYGMLFTAGLLLAALVVLDRRFEFLPNFINGLFSGLSITFLLIGGAFKRRTDDTDK